MFQEPLITFKKGKSSVEPLHYVIFHPESSRERIYIEGSAIVEGRHQKWAGHIWVDDENGNEDPYVLTDRWLYSYCHATQLRRAPAPTGCVSSGSFLFFCDGDAANTSYLMIDTVFVVSHVAEWPSLPGGLPEEFQSHFNKVESDLWSRHFRFPFEGEHAGKFTYVASAYYEGVREYSFLPLNEQGVRVAIEFSQLSRNTRGAISCKVRGKFPALLDKSQKNEVLGRVRELAKIQVVIISARKSPMSGRSNATCGLSRERSKRC